MTAKAAIELAHDILEAVDADLIDPTSGGFKHQPDYKDDADVIGAVEAAYVAHGGVIDPNVKQIIAGVVAVLAIYGART